MKRDTLGGGVRDSVTKCHKSQGGGRGLTKMTLDIFSKFLSCIFDEGQICRLHPVTEIAATYEKKVELLFHCLSNKLPLKCEFQKFSRQPNLILKTLIKN